jgi:hypothetical protein
VVLVSLCVLCQQPVLALAEEVGEQDTYVSPLQDYQGWQEPVVRDWQETHRLVTAESSGHAGHSGMAMPDMPQPKAQPSQPVMDMNNMTNQEGHDGMNHQNMNMPTMSPETMPSSHTHQEGQHK